MKFDIKKLAYCGIYCAQCSLAVTNETGIREHILRTPWEKIKQKDLSELACAGCKSVTDCNGLENCGIKNCAIEKEIDCCADCKDFPCEKTLSFRNDGLHYHLLAFENLEKIRDVGRENWFEDFKENLYCHCGERSSWFCKCPVHTSATT